jgi:hypothetical protein
LRAPTAGEETRVVELNEVCAVTLAMAVSIGWGVFLAELVVLAWLVARHDR